MKCSFCPGVAKLQASLWGSSLLLLSGQYLSQLRPTTKFYTQPSWITTRCLCTFFFFGFFALPVVLIIMGMQVWLELMDEAVQETSLEKVDRNREAQHKYLTWRAEKVWFIVHWNRSAHKISVLLLSWSPSFLYVIHRSLIDLFCSIFRILVIHC